MKLAVAGVAIGLIASLALTRVMRALLFGVDANRPAHVRSQRAAADGGGPVRLLAARAPRNEDRSNSGAEI